MASYPNLGPVGQGYISEQEYKALFGYPSGKVNRAFNQEVPGTSRIYVFQEQIFGFGVPATAPTDLSSPEDVIIGTSTVAGKKQVSDGNSYIAYYNDLILSTSQ